MKYRAEIDGLRALAVVPVILYHAGFSLFQGGYVGVDIFFVISGFLITRIIHDEIQQGQFSIARFYERRARRILPALFLICLLSLPFAWAWMLPSAFKDFGHSLIAVSLFSSNFLFAGESGYFAAATELKPLLHTWSLGVEEQFYLFFPLLLLALHKLNNTRLIIILAVISLGSLGLSEWASLHYPAENFYWLFSRAWELGAGAMLALALPFMRPLPVKQAQYLSAMGLMLIVYAILAFDPSLSFPGRWGLIPITGTLLIIAFASSGTLVGRFLSHKYMVAIGLISYSAYLWHQPLFAFARIQSADSIPLLLLLSAATFPLAYFSWRFVEAPFRNKNNYSRRQIFSAALLVSSLLIGVGSVISLNHGFDYRYTKQQKQLLAYLDYQPEEDYQSGRCFLTKQQTASEFDQSCFSLLAAKQQVVLWGDSHAAALSYGLRQQHPGLIQLTASACSPLLDYDQKRRPNCRKINQSILDFIGKNQPEKVILHANWRDSYGKPPRPLEQLLGSTLDRIHTASPGSSILLLGNTPQWLPSLPDRLISTRTALVANSYLQSRMYEERHHIDQRLEAIAVKSNTAYLSLLSMLCKQSSCLALIEGNMHAVPLVWDDAHLTPEASVLLAGKIANSQLDPPIPAPDK